MTSKNTPDQSKGEIAIYQDKRGTTRIEVKFEHETVWLRQEQISKLFNTDRSSITKHIGNIFKTQEVPEKSNVQFLHIANSDKPVKLYSLDVILSVGYRVNSKSATQFRIWATSVLKRYLVQGYALNEKRLKAQSDKIKALQGAVQLLSNVATLDYVTDEAKGIIQIISEYSRALDILDDYDHERLSTPKGTNRQLYILTYDEAISLIAIMKKKFNDSTLVGQERDQSFKGSLGAVYQSFAGKDVYSTIEEKAAQLQQILR